MRGRAVIPIVVILAGAGGFAWWWLTQREAPAEELLLFGNVELRQVELAFKDSGRIIEIPVEEGDQVVEGEILARLDTGRLRPRIAAAEAAVAARQAAVDRLRNGTRPEEVAQARANVDAARAELTNARRQHERVTSLVATAGGRAAITEREVDAAKAALDTAAARLEVSERALDLAVAGPRAEDIAEAEAELDASRAELALLRQELADAELAAPVGGVVRSRLMEPGEMASPERPVLSLAIVDPKWIRAYVSEPDLARVRPGMVAEITVDGLPGERLAGRIGFISPVAEFTPRSVQTEELRTSLVYEVRVNVEDAGDALRLGMPVTVHLPGAGTESAVAASEPPR